MRPYANEGYPRSKASGAIEPPIMPSTNGLPHQHSFYRRPLWWLHRKSWMRWECACGLTTRSYDAVDRMMTRPIHPHMSVAVIGYNTKGRP